MVEAENGLAIGNIVSLISRWERRGLLVERGASPAETSTNDQEITSLLTVIVQSAVARQVVLHINLQEAQVVLEVMHDTVTRGLLSDAADNTKLRRLMLKLSATRDVLPSSLFIAGIQDRDEHPVSAGGFGDVYKGVYNGGCVAMKRIRIFTGEASSSQKSKFCREALLWQTLDRHPSIVPFLGVDKHTFPLAYCMISPWMDHGTVLKYLTENGRSQVTLTQLLLQIAEGIEYLHSVSVIHGDIRGTNVLIATSSNLNSATSSAGFQACLTDFGLATVVIGEGESNAGMTSSSNRAGSLRWFAPELLSPQAFDCEKFARTTATDIYAFACVCVELHTLAPPFAKIQDPTVIIEVINGRRPERPVGMLDGIWEITSKGWASKWRERLTIQDIVRRLRGL
ncbi:kinase-like protein [Favolaschia claudopus]|uniref:Kinase-like protein n=1 Tax=Favolaschia claudopus TaxID=2862362 RepID=A0AAV9ZQE4_9AGAR